MVIKFLSVSKQSIPKKDIQSSITIDAPKAEVLSGGTEIVNSSNLGNCKRSGGPAFAANFLRKNHQNAYNIF